MTLAVEPMINIGRPGVRWLDDEWTVVTEDGSPVCSLREYDSGW